MLQNLFALLSDFQTKASAYVCIPSKFMVKDLIEILIVSVLFYNVLIWIKKTRAWNLFKGMILILLFVLLAYIFKMSTIQWIAENMLNIGLMALVVIFQPELRKALDDIGGRSMFSKMFTLSRDDAMKFTDKTIDEIIRACVAMGKVKTGALIVIEDEIGLDEYIRTGIDVDALLTSQLLINIFEKNTPLHDGALIVRGDRIVAATCYLPLSDSMTLSKDLGTRHRAAVGISEVSDSVTIAVSEETGGISMAMKGQIYRNVDPEFIKEHLLYLQKNRSEVTRFELLKRRFKNEKKNSKNLN